MTFSSPLGNRLCAVVREKLLGDNLNQVSNAIVEYHAKRQFISELSQNVLA